MKYTLLKSTYNILGAISIGNGVWMILSASTWYRKMPINAEDTGPLNPHFVHDIGLVYLLVGVGAFWCAYRLTKCIEVHIGITTFMLGHAIIHIAEILLNHLPSNHWLIDFPLVTLPAIILTGITPILFKNKL